MKILTVCGAGLGSSLILRIGVEQALRDMGVKAQVEAMDGSWAASTPADLIITGPHMVKLLSGIKTPIVVVKNFVSKAEIREKLQEYFRQKGIAC